MGHQCEFRDEFEVINISRRKIPDDIHSMFLLFRPKVVNAIKNIRKGKKRPENDSILDYIIKTEG